MTAAVRDLAMSHPGQFAIHIGGSCKELWAHNPHVVEVHGSRLPFSIPIVRVSYRRQLLEANERRLHFVTAFHRAVSESLDIDIPVLMPHGDLHLSEAEKQERPYGGRYWYFVAGGKADIRTKIWPAESAQKLVDLLALEGIDVIQGGASLPGHEHPQLRCAMTTVGTTSLRDVLRFIYHAEGVICPVTFAMHVAAALQKPCVVTAGGREPWWWEAYINSGDRHFGNRSRELAVPHQFLHSIGHLPCCETTGCWKTKLSQSPQAGPDTCLHPVALRGHDLLYANCLVMTAPEKVRDAVLSYYRDKFISPIFPAQP